MTPFAIKLALPVVELVAAGWIFWRYKSQRHPALTALALCEVSGQLLQFVGLSGSILLLLAARYGASFESSTYSRLSISRAAFARGAALVFGLSALAAAQTGLSPEERQYLFRSYATLAVCVWQWAVVIYRHFYPVLECQRHRVSRIGLALWLSPLASAGVFVSGGIGYLIFPCTRSTWVIVEAATYGTLLLIALLAIGTLVPGRKRAAVWQSKGKVVTGKLERVAA